ncbi:MAG TPA: molybdopterin-binding protein, partial [Bacteroidales bacterium]|nr:molybdopterin-binding protein [Bacteroidales bacterium]
DAIYDNVDFIFTTGGTGIGPRDITLEVVSKFIEKEIPGIMDSIRLKYGENLPAALISRSIAGIAQNSVIFTLPGSVKAINEYISEIKKNILHISYMIKGLDVHNI